MSSASPTGVILLGHGSREPGAEAEIRALAAALAASTPGTRFAHAFLNQPPRLDEAAAALVQAGCGRVRVLPLLVFTGRHVAEDVPVAMDALRAAHPSVAFELATHLYRLPGFTDLLRAAAADSSPETHA